MKIIGHRKQIDFLNSLKEKDRVPHGLLFTGVEKVGKKRVALEFIKSLNCKDVCQSCYECRSIEERRHPDIFFLEQDEEIQIEQIREIQKKISLTGQSIDSFKAVIVDKAHLMNPFAQSALLKTLEEPKGRVVIILITQHPDLLIPTINSRVWRVNFSLLKEEEIKDFLTELGEEDVDEISKLSSGKPGLAKDLVEKKELRKNQKAQMNEFINLLNSNVAFRLNYIKGIKKERSEVKEMLKIWLSVLRGKMMEELKKGKISKETEKLIKNTQEALFLISTTNVNQKLYLEKIILNI